MANGSGVLFDIDGTLLDSSYHHALAWTRALRQHGHPLVTVAQVHRVIGLGDDQLVPHLIGHSDSAIADAHSEEYAAMREEVQALPGVAQLLQRCDAAGAASGAGDQRQGQGPGLDAAANRGRGARRGVRYLRGRQGDQTGAGPPADRC